MKLLCVGQLGWDITTIGNNTKKNFGGSVLHFSLAAALMGLKSDILCYVNKTEWKVLLEHLQEIGIGTNLVIDFDSTINFHMFYDNNMNFCEDKFSMDISKNEPSILCEIANHTKYDLYNICETTPEQDWNTLKKISDYSPESKISMQFHIDNLTRNKKIYMDMLHSIDYVFMNLSEALYISDSTTIVGAIDYLKPKIKEVLFITSHDENYAITKDKTIKMKTIPINKVVDPTGAGDCFAGGAIAGLNLNNNLEDALRFGTISSYLKLNDYSSNKLLDILSIYR